MCACMCVYKDGIREERATDKTIKIEIEHT